MEKMRIGIVGYGNLGKGVELAVSRQEDMELVGIFTRRNPEKIQTQLSSSKVFSVELLQETQDIDVLILCTGSASDLPMQTPSFAKTYNVVDSFDHHEEIPRHFDKVNQCALEGGKLALISCGWDPGLFSLIRVLFAAVMTDGTPYTFWGKGISQGHSDAIRQIKGVKDARQYTIPKDEIIQGVLEGTLQNLTAKDMHKRDCYVVVEDYADLNHISQEIKNMPDYFARYETTVHYISEEELMVNHQGFPHGGTVLAVGKTGLYFDEHAIAEFRLQLDSNPNFTASVLVAYARAVHQMSKEGETGCRTVLDIPVGKLIAYHFMEKLSTCV